MTDREKLDAADTTWQTKDIRAKNLSIRWETIANSLLSILLMLLDASMLFAAWTIADRLGTPTVGLQLSSSIVPIVVVSISTLAASGLYGTDDKLHRFSKLFRALTLAQLVVLITAFFYHPELWVSRSVFLIAWILNFVSIGTARFLFDLAIIEIRKRNLIFQEAIVLMGDRVDIENVRKLLKRSQQFRIDSIIDLSIWDVQLQLDEIIDQIRSRKISEVFICSPQLIDNQIILFWNLKAAGVHLRIVPTEMELPLRSAETKMIEEIPTIRFKSLAIFGFNFWLKRVIDIVGSFTILLLISPILLFIAFLVKQTSPGPIFYRQARVGLKGRRFQVWKFRTMVQNASELQQELEAQNEVKGGVLFKIKKDPRITPIGKFLRDYSLDELPQLMNVLQGQMSMVGPRPLPIRDYELSIENMEEFSRDRFLRYEVLPGITGLWQVKGRATIDSDEIFYWDTVYILQWSLALDLRILLQTVKVVLFKEGSY
jgi:exopolysaccharide biosynthesis polyprenyl glycosylphosphotransferase